MTQPTISERESPRYPVFARIVALVIIVVLGWFLAGYAGECWNDYWLLKDGQQGMAVVTYPLWTGHNAVAYRYAANGRQYVGKSSRNFRDPRYMNVGIGDQSVVYYSASHPWLSSLRRPESLGAGWPVILLVLALEVLAIVTLINPRHRWALNFETRSGKR